jgi:NADH-quinone oxidoreductase subunit N
LLSNEASLKYVLFGSVATGVMLYGLTFLYGLAGTTSLAGVREAVATTTASPGLMSLFAVLVLAGFGFKIAAVPFHFWCPDVYQGAPTPVAAFLSIAPKAAGFAILVRFFLTGWPVPQGIGPSGELDWPWIVMVLAALTMTVGNVAALTQTDMKRLLAYSSIGHAGFILMGLAAASATGTKGVVVYLLVYLAMNLGAFLVVAIIHAHEGSFDLRDYGGLWRRSPLLVGAMAFFLLSLTGIPPFLGFMAKLYVFAAVIERGAALLAVVGALNAAVAAFFYFRVLRAMVIDADGAERGPLLLGRADAVSLGVLAAANVLPLLSWNVVERVAAGAVLWGP